MVKAVLKFLLHTATGKILVQAIVRWAVSLVRKKLDKIPIRSKQDLDNALEIIDLEIHAQVETENVTDLI